MWGFAGKRFGERRFHKERKRRIGNRTFAFNFQRKRSERASESQTLDLNENDVKLFKTRKLYSTVLRRRSIGLEITMHFCPFDPNVFSANEVFRSSTFYR